MSSGQSEPEKQPSEQSRHDPLWEREKERKLEKEDQRHLDLELFREHDPAPQGEAWEKLRDLARTHDSTELLTDSLAAEIITTLLATNLARSPEMQAVLPGLAREITEEMLDNPQARDHLEGLWRQVRESLK